MTRKVHSVRAQYIDLGLSAKDSEAIAKWYDALSNNYDELYGEEQAQKHARVLGLLGNKETKLILDLGCGTGKLLGSLSSKTQTAVGIDLSVQMLAKAKQRIAWDATHLIRADGSHLPLQNGVADGVVSISVTESGPKLIEHLNEISRVSSSEATLAMSIFGTDDKTVRQLLGESSTELVATLSDRERLYLRQRKRLVNKSFESSALV